MSVSRAIFSKYGDWWCLLLFSCIIIIILGDFLPSSINTGIAAAVG
jgi:hypothetical protein